MKKEKLFLIAAALVLLSSCARSISPYEAANGKARCGRWVR